MNIEKLKQKINTQPQWATLELIDLIDSMTPKYTINFMYIGGYELLRDGTIIETAHSIKDIHSILDNYEVNYDETITDPYTLVDSVKAVWAKRHNNGGGSGWIEY